MEYRPYSVSRRDREPLLNFMLSALEGEGCRILHAPEPTQAPFRITFETPTGERFGIVAYAFLANSKLTRSRPADEHRFQLKYGSDDKQLHALWQDPYLLYTTLLVGIDPELGIFVGADPEMHNPTKFFISIEFKRSHVEAILQKGWYSWEREHRGDHSEHPTEVLVGGTARSFLRYVRFEREALREEPGPRQLLAERFAVEDSPLVLPAMPGAADSVPPAARLHSLAREFELDESEVLDLIAHARRLKMAVRGWVAEEHLVRKLRQIRGVTECERVDEEGQPDVRLRFEGSRLLTVECKNVLRQRAADGVPRLDFKRTRNSMGDPSSRYYSPEDFDVVAACLHAVTERWEFRYVLSRQLARHAKFPGKLASNVRIDDCWSEDVRQVLRAAVTSS